MIKVINIKRITKCIVKIVLIVAISLSFLFIFKNKTTSARLIQVANTSNNKYEILVDVEDSKLFLLENGKLIKEYKCSGGKRSTPSPIGTWKIISKSDWGEGFRADILWA